MPEPFKNRFSPAVVRQIGAGLAANHADFDVHGFVRDGLDGLDALELKDRVRHIAATLKKWLPDDFPAAAAALVGILAEPVDEGAMEITAESDRGIRGMPVMALTHFIGEYGLKHVDVALATLGEMTRRCTAEFDIRPFIQHHQEAAWIQIDAWSRSDDVHQRRLASEGSRPYLPWGVRVPSLRDTPDRNFRVLNRLKDDPSEYVRRSVANHLNDLSRDHRDRVVEVTTRWLAEDPKRKPLVKHALRTLSKRSDPDVLALFGFDPDAPITVTGFSVGEVVREGESLPFAFTVTHQGDPGSTPANLLVEYLLHYVKSRGERSPKVFQISRGSQAAGTTKRVERNHSFKAVTTRKHYPGAHRFELRINGRIHAGAEFNLIID